MLQCPQCHKDMAEPTDGTRSKCYPFCCERCKLIDLGAWLDAEYVIKSAPPSTDPDVNDDGYSRLASGTCHCFCACLRSVKN